MKPRTEPKSVDLNSRKELDEIENVKIKMENDKHKMAKLFLALHFKNT